MYTSPDASGYDIRDTIFEDNGIGLYLGSSGDHTTIVCRNRFIANNEFEGTGGANGIYSDEGAQDVLITTNRFEGHNTSAIFFADVDEDPATPPVLQRDILVEGNTSVDDLSFAVVYNTRVRLTGNDITARVGDEDFPGPASAIRNGARSHDVVVDRNRIRSASGNGIHVTDWGEPDHDPAPPTGVLVLKNKVEHAELLGIDVSASGVREYEVRGNRALANGKVGIHLGPESDDALVTGNTALDNGGEDGGFDCQDEPKGESATDGPAGTENTWQENVGATADPAGICSAPADNDEPAGDGKDHHGHGKSHKKKHHKQHPKHRPDPSECGSLPRRF
jgi:Right handed beta helix region